MSFLSICAQKKTDDHRIFRDCLQISAHFVHFYKSRWPPFYERIPTRIPIRTSWSSWLQLLFPHRLIHTHMPGRRVSKSDLICFPSFIAQIRPIMTLKSNNLYTIAIISLPICISCLKKPKPAIVTGEYLSSGYFNGKKTACAFHTFMHLNLIIKSSNWKEALLLLPVFNFSLLS